MFKKMLVITDSALTRRLSESTVSPMLIAAHLRLWRTANRIAERVYGTLSQPSEPEVLVKWVDYPDHKLQEKIEYALSLCTRVEAVIGFMSKYDRCLSLQIRMLSGETQYGMVVLDTSIDQTNHPVGMSPDAVWLAGHGFLYAMVS